MMLGERAIISGVALPEKDLRRGRLVEISGTPITVPSAVFFVIATVRLVIGGTVRRTACGSTM